MQTVAHLIFKNQTGNISQSIYTAASDENLAIFISYTTHASAGQAFNFSITSSVPNTSPVLTASNGGTQGSTTAQIWSAITAFTNAAAGTNVNISVTATGTPNYDFSVTLVKL